MVNGMNILHSVDNDSFKDFDIFKTANNTDSTTLNQNITLSQQLKCFQCISIWANKSLSSFNESLFVSDKRPDFNDFTEHAVFHDFKGLLIRYTSTDQFDHISGLDD